MKTAEIDPTSRNMEESYSDSNFGRYNLRDNPVIDSLLALSQTYADNYEIAVVGGMGVALYCWPEIIEERYTNDLDTSTTEHITMRTFNQGVGKSLMDHLVEMDHYTTPWKGHRNYGLDVFYDDNKGVFFITLPRRSRKHYNLFESIIRREYDNAEELDVPTMENEMFTIKVVRPEDLIVPKLHRMAEKDIIDIKAIMTATKDSKDMPFDWKYFRESALLWNNGVEKLAEADVEKLKKLRETL